MAFNAREFKRVLHSAVGKDRDEMTSRLRDATVLKNAISELQNFTERAKSFLGEGDDGFSEGPSKGKLSEKVAIQDSNVVGAYLLVSKDADELFHALRAVQIAPALALAALNALMVISRYARGGERLRDLENPPSSESNVHASGNITSTASAASRVLKNVVKSRAVHIYDVFVSGRSDCMQIALHLLQATANNHPLLAKEILNRFDLTSKYFAPSLCTVSNHRCRLPFIKLITDLIKVSDAEVSALLCSDARPALIACLSVTIERLRVELSHGQVLSKQKEQPEQDDDAAKDHDLDHERKSGKALSFRIFPSNIQKRELDGAISFIYAILNRLVTLPAPFLRRSFFAQPFSIIVAAIAAAPLPPLTVVPRNVTQHHAKLRTAALKLLVGMATTAGVTAGQIAVGLAKTPAPKGDPNALHVVVAVIRAQPAVAHAILVSGHLLTYPPQLSCSWVGIASVIALCVQLSKSAVQSFAKRKYFEACLKHKAPLVRHWGALITLALARVVANDPKTAESPSRYLPHLKHVYKYVLASPSDEVAHQLLFAYQVIFEKFPDEVQMDVMQASLKVFKNNYYAAEASIRFALSRDPYTVVRKLLGSNHLSAIIIQTAYVTSINERNRLWRLAADIVRHTDLFPQGTISEVDIYFCVLSSFGEHDLEICAKEFEHILLSTIATPYGAFDELHDVISQTPNPFPRASLIAVRFCRKLRTWTEPLCGKSSDDEIVFKFLKKSLLSILACDEIVNGHVFTSSFLALALPAVLPDKNVSWIQTSGLTDREPTRVETCIYAQCLFHNRVGYIETPFLRAVKHAASFRALVRSEKCDDVRLWQTGVKIGLLWDSLIEYDESKVPYNPRADPGVILFNGVSQERAPYLADLGALILEAKSTDMPDLSANDGFFQLRKQIGATDFLFFMSVVLLTAKEERSRKMAVHNIVNGLRGFVDNTGRNELLQFAQSCMLSFLEFVPSRRFREVGKILQYTAKTLFNARASVSTDLSRHLDTLSFYFDMLHIVAFHSQQEICVQTRMVLRGMRLCTLPPLYLFSSKSLTQLSKLYIYFPALATQTNKQLLSWSSHEFALCPAYVLPFICTILQIIEEQDKAKSLAAQWHVFCSSLLETKMSPNNKKVQEILSLDSSGARGIVDRIGGWAGFECKRVNFLLENLLDELSSEKDKKEVQIFVWVILANLCRRRNTGTNVFSFGSFANFNTTLNQFVSTILEALASPDSSFSTLLFTVFYEFLRYVETDVAPTLKERGKNRGLRKSLKKLFCAIAEALCSWISKDFASFSAGSRTGFTWDGHIFCLSLHCLSVLILLNAANTPDLENVLLNLKKHYFRYIFLLTKDKPKMSSELMDKSLLSGICDTLTAAVDYFQNHRISAELCWVFGSAQALLSLDYVGFSAKATARDISVRKCYQAIDAFLVQSGALAQFSVTRRGKHYFYQSAAVVLQQFDKDCLSSARADVYAWSSSSRGRILKNSPSSPNNKANARNHGTDSEFVLRLFYGACKEALDSPDVPVIDLGKIAREGALAVAITALSVPYKQARMLGYACLQLFSDVVGPMSNVRSGVAAGLYKDRRQLSFLLQLLRHSIGDINTQVLPLFASWFITALRVALSPSHSSYNQMTFFLLRNATLDVYDCVGAYDLLNSGGIELEVKNARLLALEIIENGVQSAADVIVIRKWKIIESVFYLGGGEDDSEVRQRALAAIAALVDREPQIRLVHELHRVHGVAGWLGCAGVGTAASPCSEVLKRMELLSSISKYMKGDVAFMEEASASLSMLVNRILLSRDSEVRKLEIASQAVTCAEVISQVVPKQTVIFDTDFATLWRWAGASFNDRFYCEDVSWKRALYVIMRQVEVCTVGDEVIEAALISRVDALEQRCVNNECSSDILIIDAFISRVLVCRMERYVQQRTHQSQTKDTFHLSRKQENERIMQQSKMVASEQMCGLLARGLDRFPTVWLTISGLCAVTVYNTVSEKVQALAANVPAMPPGKVTIECANSYSSAVAALQVPLLKDLLRVTEKVHCAF